MSGGLAEAVKNGPRATTARVREMEARIRLADHKASSLQQSANSHARRAKGDGPMAKYHRAQAASLTSAADRQRATAADLRVKLAKIRAEHAAKDARHARHLVASTRDEFGTGPASGGQRPGQVANPGQPIKTGGGQVANHPQEIPVHPKVKPETRGPMCPCCGYHHGPDYKPQRGKHCGLCQGHKRGGWPNYVPAPSKSQPTQPKGPTMPISGDAVNIEQTRADLDQLKGQVAGLRNSFESMSGSLASGGLPKLAGSLATADDALDSVNAQIEAAERQLADQQGIAEAAQAAGEMHSSSSFYDVGSSPSGGAWSRALDPRAGLTPRDRRAFNERVRHGDPSNGNR